MDRKPLLPVLLRRGVLPAPAAARSLFDDLLAQSHGRRTAAGAAPGEPCGGDQERGDEAGRSRPRHRRHHGAAEERHLSDRRQAASTGRARSSWRWPKSSASSCASPMRGSASSRSIKHQRYAHARQFDRAKKALRKLKTYLGRIIRNIARKIDGEPWLETAFARLLRLARRVRDQERGQRGPKVYSLHAPEVECIGKGKPHKPYEFGVKVSVATTLKHCKGGQFVIHVQALPGNPYDGHTLARIIPGDRGTSSATPSSALHADAGYRGHNAPPEYKFKVYTSKQKRRVTPQIKREMRRRSAIEPVIGHLKNEHRMDRNYLAGRSRRRQQRHPRRRRLQLPPPDQVDHALIRPRPARDLDRRQNQPAPKRQFFTDDEIRTSDFSPRHRALPRIFANPEGVDSPPELLTPFRPGSEEPAKHGVSKDGPKRCGLWPSFETPCCARLLRMRSEVKTRYRFTRSMKWQVATMARPAPVFCV